MGKVSAWIGTIAFLAFIVLAAALLMGPWAGKALLIATTGPMEAGGAQRRLISCCHGQVEVFVVRTPGRSASFALAPDTIPCSTMPTCACWMERSLGCGVERARRRIEGPFIDCG